MEVIRGSSEPSAQLILSAESCCISCDLFLKNMEKALYVWLEDKTQTWLLVSSFVRELAMPVKADMRYVYEVKESRT
jgi:hypothetical protein